MSSVNREQQSTGSHSNLSTFQYVQQNSQSSTHDLPLKRERPCFELSDYYFQPSRTDFENDAEKLAWSIQVYAEATSKILNCVHGLEQFFPNALRDGDNENLLSIVGVLFKVSTRCSQMLQIIFCPPERQREGPLSAGFEPSEVLSLERLIELYRKFKETFAKIREIFGNFRAKLKNGNIFQAFVAMYAAMIKAEIQVFVDPETRQLHLPFVKLKEEILQVYHFEDMTIEIISKMIVSGEIGFPYKQYHMVLDRYQLFHNLVCHKAREERTHIKYIRHLRFKSNGFFPLTFRGDPTSLVFVTTEEDYHRIDAIADLFTEEARMKASRIDQGKSPLELWCSKPDVQILLRKEFFERADQDITSFTLREAIYHQVSECTQFKSTLSKAIIEKLHARRVLDFSAGWGDRLIGAIAAKVDRYLAFDPNETGLRKGHKEIIESFCSSEEEKSRFEIRYQPFEQAEISNQETFDLVFSSPPHFNFEIYARDQSGQSIETFPSYEDWFVQFLCQILKLSWSHLAEDGFLAVYISDTKAAPCCELMNVFVQVFLKNSFYEGIIAANGVNEVPRPTWLWRKKRPIEVNENDRSRIAEADSIGNQHFRKLWAKVCDFHSVPVGSGSP